MADLITIQSGQKPWTPTLDSEVVEIYNQYDVPTAGVLRQQGVDFLFQCISEGQSRISVWVYVLLEGTERELIEQALTEDFEVRVDSIVRSRSSMLAIAVEGFGIFASTLVEVWNRDIKRESDRLFELLESWFDGLKATAESEHLIHDRFIEGLE